MYIEQVHKLTQQIHENTYIGQTVKRNQHGERYGIQKYITKGNAKHIKSDCGLQAENKEQLNE